jgi:hypothetical protein
VSHRPRLQDAGYGATGGKHCTQHLIDDAGVCAALLQEHAGNRASLISIKTISAR